MVNKKVFDTIKNIIAGAFIKYTNEDILKIIAITDGFNARGYKLSYKEVAEFIANKRNRELIEKDGLTKTLEAMPNMRLGTIRRDAPKINRNSKCPCGSGNKFKKCCINKS